MLRPHGLLLIAFCLLLFVVYLQPQTSISQSVYHSLSLNGTSSYVSVPNSASINISGAITIEAWIKVNAITGNYQDIVCRESWGQVGTGGGYELSITNTGKVRLDLYQSHNQYTTAIGSTTVTTGTWHHVAGVFDGSQMRVYLNGVLDGSLSTTNGPASGTSSLNIGKSTYTTYYFGGLIDQVRISAAALYSANFTPGLGPANNTRAFWKFDGQTTNDVSGNGNHGTLQGGATYSTNVPPSSNNAPAVSITHPQNNTSIASGSTVMIDANATDSDGVVTKVDFYQSTTLLGTDTSAPYSFSWSNVPGGVYSLTAKATDDNGAVTTSGALTLNVIDSVIPHSLSLNGTSSYVSVPNSATINISGAITIEAWIKVNAITGNYQDIVCRASFAQAGTGGGYEMSITNIGKLRLDLYQSHNQYTTVIGSTTVTTGTWHHVAGVFDGSQMRVYLNGVLDGSLSTTNGPASGTSPLHIGKSIYTTYYFGGLIDQLRISAAALYSSNFTPGLGPANNTRAFWNFDGQTTNDASGNGNHGTLQGGATYSTTVPPQSGGQRPVPIAGGPYNGLTAQAVQFSSTGSADPDGTIVSYHWNFGDSTSANTANPSHAYAAPGLYTVTLTVTDNTGLLASITTPVNISGGSDARLDPLNQTGGGGENPLSQNFNWTVPLVSLPGRAGLDLGLTLSYNSLVWTRTGNYISFDDDRGFPGPGFRLGFPVIQPMHYNSETGTYGFVLIGADGSRTELRRVGASSLYEAADSSHLLLDVNTMTLRTTDGTQLSYAFKGSEYQCTQIKDRNGNYISITYTPFGRIDEIVDTLARHVKFNYDANGYLTSITQAWNETPTSSDTHTWASFEYVQTNIDTNFSTSLTMVGTSNGWQEKTLSKVTFADGSHYDFSYSTWGQVWKISFIADSQLLNYRSYNLPQTKGSNAYSDCPRFTQRRDWAIYWNGDTDGTAATNEEALTLFSGPVSDTWTMPDQTPQSGTRAEVTTPDGTTTRIYFVGTAGDSSGWRRGLPLLVDTVSGNDIKRRVVTTWTQDNTLLSYPLNPRLTETNIYDNANRARTEISYQQFAFANATSCWLPRDVFEYADDNTVLRTTRTTYNTSTSYSDRHILGLPSEKLLYEGNLGALKSKVEFLYDGSGSIEGNDAPVQHDNTNYSAAFVTGRANLSSVRRYNVDNLSEYTTTSSNYNTAGAVVSSEDASEHVVRFSYADSFSDNVPRSTFAYPTTVTDPDNFTSTSKYDFDFGGMTYRQTPMPNVTTNTPGPEQTFTFDTIGRLERITNEVNDAYTRFIYAANQLRVDTYVTIEEVLGEAHSFRITDGHGRVIATAADHPGTGVVGDRFSGQRMLYDVMGRVIKTSNPAETSAGGTPFQWTTTGDDATAGWLYTEQTYDWKGRPLRTTHPDTTYREASYSGCGCAGGEVVTLTDEGTIHAGTPKRRQQKIYSDVLGRTMKTEILNWDGSGEDGTGGNPYSTTVVTYNVRDQITAITEYAGPASGGSTSQETTMTYDGYGRLSTRHEPKQEQGKDTTWTYNADDTVQSVTDARGAVTSFTYNARHLPTVISHTLTGTSTIVKSFTYDIAGNRKSILNTVGGVAQDSADYTYDALSRLTLETKHINALAGNSMSGNYTISYAYTLSGQLQSITDPFISTTNYSYDKVGRLLTATSNYGGVTRNYLGAVEYRAWDGIKSMSFRGGVVSTIEYNARMLPTQFRGPSGSPGRFDYSYYSDGRLKSMLDLDDQVGHPSQVQFHYMSRQYSYDQANRISAVGGVNNHNVLPPFSGSYGYDAFGNMTSRSGNYALNQTVNDSATYTKNRRGGWTYDADGRVKISPDPTTGGTRNWTYDAVGNTTFVSENVSGVTATNTLVYDGDDELLKDTVVRNGVTTSNYLINSTVLGKVLVKLDASGNKDTTYVPLNQLVTPLEQKDFQGNPIVRWLTRDASGLQENDRAADPLGNLIHNVQPPVVGPPPYVPFYGPGYMNPSGAEFTEANNYAMSCVLDGITAPCEQVMRAVNNQSVDPNSLRLSTTGGLADFANAGLGGLVLDLNNQRQVWRNDPVGHSGAPKWRPPKSRARLPGGGTPDDPPYWRPQRRRGIWPLGDLL